MKPEPVAKLPMRLQIDNMILAPAQLLTPIWWASMLFSDARDKRRGKWRLPTMPKLLSFTVPPGIAPVEITYYLNGLGIQTALVGLAWEVVAGVICLHKTLLIPGRQYKWASTCVDRFLAGDPVPQRGPMIGANNIEMIVSRAFDSIVGVNLVMNGKSAVKEMRRRRKRSGPGLAQRAAAWLEE
jgi:hypothetical protein